MKTDSSSSLYKSLAGCSIEFRDGKSQEHLNSGPALKLLQSKITSYCTEALRMAKEDSLFGIVALSVCMDYYRKNSNYFSVRSSIVLRRLRPQVLEFLELPTDDKCTKLLKVFKKHRDDTITLDALKYFLGLYPSRYKDFKNLLNKEEKVYVL